MEVVSGPGVKSALSLPDTEELGSVAVKRVGVEDKNRVVEVVEEVRTAAPREREAILESILWCCEWCDIVRENFWKISL